MAQQEKYARSQIILHWLVAVLIGANYLLGDFMVEAFERVIDTGVVGDIGLAANSHRAIGVAVILLVLVRLVLRWRLGAPAESTAGPLWLQPAAKAGHVALYALILAVPITGAVVFNGQIEALGEVHEALTSLLLLLVLGHALMAIYYHVVLKDGLLNRMR